MQDVLAGEGRDFQAEIDQAQRYVQAARSAVLAGLDAYLECLQHSSAAVRQRAFALLCALPECSAAFLPTLLAALEAEPDPEAQARMVPALGLLLHAAEAAAHRTSGVEILDRVVRSTEHRSVRFAAAMALTILEGDGAPLEAITILEQAILEPGGLRPGSPGRGGEPAYLQELTVESACQALSHLRVERRTAILVSLLERIGAPEHAHQVAVLLLDSALRGQGRTLLFSATPEATEKTIYYTRAHPTGANAVGERLYPQAQQARDPASLDPREREALRAVLDCEPLWRIPSNLLEIYGLPRSRASLCLLL
jgi:hypothetical protein